MFSRCSSQTTVSSNEGPATTIIEVTHHPYIVVTMDWLVILLQSTAKHSSKMPKLSPQLGFTTALWDKDSYAHATGEETEAYSDLLNSHK